VSAQAIRVVLSYIDYVNARTWNKCLDEPYSVAG
jgi:hypothetical protein